MDLKRNNFNFDLPKLLAYCEQNSTPQSSILYDLERETHLKTLSPIMLSGHIQGQLLAFISQMMQPNLVLEIGTFTGYATICLAQGVGVGGQVHTIEPNKELAHIIQKFIAKADLEQFVTLHLGRAEEIIPNLPNEFDLVFLDAGKHDYSTHFDLVIDKVKSGGFILADNVLWNGRVVEEPLDKAARVMDMFNAKIQQDDRVENLILPIRDGIQMIRKR